MSIDQVRRSRPLVWMRRAILTILALALLMAAVIGIWLYVNRNNFQVRFFAPDSTDLLEQVIAEAKLPTDGASKVEHTYADGTTPDMARQTLHLNQRPEAIAKAVGRACRKLGFRPPDADVKAVEPDTLCTGDWQKVGSGISLYTKCDKTCEATIETYILPF